MMPLVVVFHETYALALDGITHNGFRLTRLVWGFECLIHLLHVIAIDVKYLESQGLKHAGVLIRDIHHLWTVSVTLHMIVVNKQREVIQSIVYGTHAGFPYTTLIAL